MGLVAPSVPPFKITSSGLANALGELLSPQNESSSHPSRMQFQRIPGAYHCSKNGVRVIYGLKLLNPPRALVELLEEVNHASPKQVFFFDSGPAIVEDNPHAVNWTDARHHPTVIPIFLNPRRAVPEVVAHELMHSWLDFYTDLEDPRSYIDPSNKLVANTVSFLQSMVLDCTVLWQLKKRGGFDLDLFRRDLMAALRENIVPFKSGMMHATPFGQLAAAQALAVPKAVPDLYGLTKEDRAELEELWQVCRQAEPVIARTAERISAALREHGYQTGSGIRSSIDKALAAAFEFLCLPFSPEKDMVQNRLQIALIDKMPEYMPGLPILSKYEALCRSILNRRPILWSSYTPETKEVTVHYAREGLPWSALGLPKVTRPKEAGEPSHLFFFEPGTTPKEMDELTPLGSSLPFPPPDIYAVQYVSGRNDFQLPSEGESHVLLP
jgi:hypothetical protein